MSKPINQKIQLSTEANCKLLLHMNETSWNGTPGEVKDASGCDNHGQAFGGLTTIAEGKFSRCGNFDGTDDYVDCGNDVSLDIAGGEITLEMWVKDLSSSLNWQILFSKNGAWLFQEAYGLHNNYYFRVFDEDGDLHATTPRIILGAGEWIHLAGTYNKNLASNQVRFYVNGVHRASATSTKPLKQLPSTHVLINKDKTISGAIDEVAIYSRAKIADEIWQDYHKQVGTHII